MSETKEKRERQVFLFFFLGVTIFHSCSTRRALLGDAARRWTITVPRLCRNRTYTLKRARRLHVAIFVRSFGNLVAARLLRPLGAMKTETANVYEWKLRSRGQILVIVCVALPLKAIREYWTLEYEQCSN